MGKCYRHLQVEDRIKLYELLFSGSPIIEIAKQLGFHKATIYRELERNSSRYGYRPDWACQQYAARKFHHLSKLDKDPALRAFVIERLREGWSPQQIDGRLRKLAGRCIISYETIYAYIYSPSGKAQKLYQLLHKKRRFRYPRIKRKQRKTASEAEKIPICERDHEINQRTTFGHWEGDILLFTKHNPHLITLRERKSRYLIAIKSMSRKPQHTTHTIVSYMKAKVNSSLYSLTLDNDISFTDHKKMAEQLNATIYFCEPYKSYQKGSIENGNRLLRRYLPKQLSLDKLTQHDIESMVEKFNHQPMKCLGYNTPTEIFFQHMGYVPTLGEIRT